MSRAIMKKCLLTAFLSLFSCICVVAQENDPWVGTWTSESYQDIDWDKSQGGGIVYANYKRIIRITKTNDEYNVRSKLIKVGDPNYTYYNPSIAVIEVDGTNMWLESYVERSPFTVNDRIDSYRDFTHRYKLTLKQGVMHFSYYEYSYTIYDKGMTFKEKGTKKVGGEGTSLDLFSDDW